MKNTHYQDFDGEALMYVPVEQSQPPWARAESKGVARTWEPGYDAARRRDLIAGGKSEAEVQRLMSQAYGVKPPQLSSDRERELRAKAEKIMNKPNYWSDQNLQADVQKIHQELSGIAP